MRSSTKTVLISLLLLSESGAFKEKYEQHTFSLLARSIPAVCFYVTVHMEVVCGTGLEILSDNSLQFSNLVVVTQKKKKHVGATSFKVATSSTHNQHGKKKNHIN